MHLCIMLNVKYHNVHVQYSCVEAVLPEVEAECQMFNENGIKPSLQVDLLKFVSSIHPTF